ncbi:hypothetical protein TSOC_008899 [Tetrabaena socialis]|uniref:Uncharacterized protein n=1 Tax=Tetrabaena socialis TaxID=47790 RepID=A0A2J7ZX91_9CHLO|nr:hypothetical protein TSOC_008899 [Tetrabaena socialis]|eukprot:PNH04884.1 hypothetical protein TSOC_008899 [Tetrabaena socialis]
MSQLREAPATAITAVLANTSGAARSLARALPPSTPAGEAGVTPAAAAVPCSGHVPGPQVPAAEGAVQLAVVAVLCNAQRYAPALRAASAGASWCSI